MTHLFKNYRFWAIVVTGTAGLFAGCGGGDDVDPDPEGQAGSGAMPAAGSGPTAGANSGGAGGSGGGSGGSSDAGAIVCATPTMELVTDFTYDASVAGAKTDAISFGDFTSTFSGGTFVFPDAATGAMHGLKSDVTENNWHISGAVGDYSGFGIYLGGCHKVDLSEFKGIQFTISGSVPSPTTPDTVVFSVGTAANAVSASWINTHKALPTDPDEIGFGRCTPTGMPPARYDTTCSAPSYPVSVTATPETVTVLWEDLTGGRPSAGVDPKEIVSIGWGLPAPTGVAMPNVVTYDVDIVIDDLKFVR